MSWSAITKLSLAALFFATTALAAQTDISLGYGLQANAFFNATLNANMQKFAFNAGAAPLVGYTGTQSYSSNWSASDITSGNAYFFVGLPELRLTSDWAYRDARLGVFASLSGILPQTSAYYLGGTQLAETNTCGGVNYNQCPLAASGFVAQSGSAQYATEIRSSMRFYNLAVGLTYGKKVATWYGFDVSLKGEAGLVLQSLSVYSQFAAALCTDGSNLPCASASLSRVVQGEMTSQANFAIGPVLGATMRFEQPQAFWFAEAALTTTVLFMNLENSGYTSFVGGGTLAFAQSTQAQGISSTQSVIAVLPAVLVRVGIHL
ncbi:MAG: hypothetical protein JSR44_01200 [Spirochaetes bacterium]|nr:hypothetical protein [Spirochaetota bacterium]